MLFISFISWTTLKQNKYKYTYITTHFIYVTKQPLIKLHLISYTVVFLSNILQILKHYTKPFIIEITLQQNYYTHCS
jgi:hypothetical protein